MKIVSNRVSFDEQRKSDNRPSVCSVTGKGELKEPFLFKFDFSQ